MTLALSTHLPARTPLELIREFHARVDRWTDPYRVAAAAATVLVEELMHPTVSILRCDPAGDELLLLAAGPAGRGNGPAAGVRVRLGTGPLRRAVREGETQRTLNSYVEPDFVRSLPGETRSELVVPIRTVSGVIGAVHLVYASPHQPETRDAETAELVASLLAPVLDAVADGGEADGSRAETEVAARLAGVLAGQDDLPAALRHLAEGARELAPSEGALVLFRHPSRQALEVAVVAGSVPVEVGDLLLMDGTVPGEAVRTGRVCAWRRSSGEGTFGLKDAELAVRDALVVPLCSAGKTFGVLALVNGTSADAFGPSEVERVQGLARIAAAVEPMRQIGPLRQRLSDNSLIAEVGRAVTGTLGLDDVLGLVVRAAEMLIGTRGVALGMITDEGDGLRLASASGALRRSQGEVIPIHASLMGHAVVAAEQVTSPCVSDDPRGFPHEPRQGPGVVIPLESRARIWGALLVTKAEGATPPTDEDIDALRKLAGYASIAIDNAHLYREQTDLSQALRAQAEELQSAYAELRRSQEQLLVSEKMAALGRVTAGIAHEINSPLGGILNCLQLAQSYAGEYQQSIRSPEVTPEDHEAIAHDLLDALQMAQAATRKVAQFVRTIKGQTRTGEEEHTEFDVAEEVQGVLHLLAAELRNRSVTVESELDPDARLTGDPGKFSLVLQNLVNNAIDAYEGREGTVVVRSRRETDAVVLEVEDHGCGIPELIRGKIFDYLFTTKDVGQGTGLGLSMVHSVVTTNFQGTIDLASQVGVGTTFTVRFPSSPQTN